MSGTLYSYSGSFYSVFKAPLYSAVISPSDFIFAFFSLLSNNCGYQGSRWYLFFVGVNLSNHNQCWSSLIQQRVWGVPFKGTNFNGAEIIQFGHTKGIFQNKIYRGLFITIIHFIWKMEGIISLHILWGLIHKMGGMASLITPMFLYKVLTSPWINYCGVTCSNCWNIFGMVIVSKK